MRESVHLISIPAPVYSMIFDFLSFTVQSIYVLSFFTIIFSLLAAASKSTKFVLNLTIVDTDTSISDSWKNKNGK